VPIAIVAKDAQELYLACTYGVSECGGFYGWGIWIFGMPLAFVSVVLFAVYLKKVGRFSYTKIALMILLWVALFWLSIHFENSLYINH